MGAPHLLELAFVDSINIRLGVKFISQSEYTRARGDGITQKVCL